MVISKLLDGFVDDDTLIIKAQVQVFGERKDLPLRCLDYQYRKNFNVCISQMVEQICHRFMEQRIERFGKLIEDKLRWSSFSSFWPVINRNSWHQLSIEKEVTSTFVMESLYSGLTALKGPLMLSICMEKNSFILVDDILLLLESAVVMGSKECKGSFKPCYNSGSWSSQSSLLVYFALLGWWLG